MSENLLNEEYYGDCQYALSKETVELYKDKYSDSENLNALEDDCVRLFDTKYGTGEYALEVHSTELVTKEYGTVWILTDDLEEFNDEYKLE